MAKGRPVAWRATTAGGTLVVFALIVLVGFNVRTPLLSVPPLLAIIRTDLDLNYTATGLLAALPTLLMGLGAWPAGRIAGHIGGRVSVGLGLTLIVVGVIARGLLPSPIALYAFTALIAAGVALSQTSIPMLVRLWFPTRIGLVSALFTDGLTIGETVAASATAPLMRVWFGPDAWPAALLIWAVPVTLTLFLWQWLAPPAPSARAAPAPASVGPSIAPDGVDAQVSQQGHATVSPWVIGGIMGAGSVIYFGMNGWIAPYNQAINAGHATSVALFAINVAQLPVTIGMTPIAGRLAGKRWPFFVGGALALVAVTGWVVTPPAFQPLWAAMMGSASSGVFVLAIALPALYGGETGVARLTGSSLTISYTAAFVGPFLGGAMWDALGVPALAFAPVALAALSLLLIPALLPRPSA